ncbi:protein PF3D7_1417600 isoform X2 [Hydra vulgaris]|uniref:protein PF3D7_1417600 isoform X2 n=1 Tax=Hydra vulgaris TaxID=6087 RepID=UPI001F5FB853|nr:protein PF3D7_1417600-like isoform X2 [Hydra vulgaris]
MLIKKIAFLLYTIGYFNAACSSLFYGKLVLKTSALNAKHYRHKPTVFATRRSTYLKKNGDVFRIHIPGIARNATHDSISFESVRWPGYFLRHRIVNNDYKFRIAKPAQEDNDFDRESTFIIQRHTGIEGSGMLRLFQNPQYYLCVRKYNNADSALKAMKNDHSKDFAERCSFFIQKLRPENVDAAVLKSTLNKKSLKVKKSEQKNDKRVRKILEEYIKNIENKNSAQTYNTKKFLDDLKHATLKTKPTLTKKVRKLYPGLSAESYTGNGLFSPQLNYIPTQVSAFYRIPNSYSYNYPYSYRNQYYNEIENKNPNLLSYFPVVSRYDPMQTDVRAFFGKKDYIKTERLGKGYNNQVGTMYGTWKKEINPRSVLGMVSIDEDSERKTHQVKRNIMKISNFARKTNKTLKQSSLNIIENQTSLFPKKYTNNLQETIKKNASLFSKKTEFKILSKLNRPFNSTELSTAVFDHKSMTKEYSLENKTFLGGKYIENMFPEPIDATKKKIILKNDYNTLLSVNHFDSIPSFVRQFNGKERSEIEKNSDNEREGHLIGLADALETSAALTVDRLSKDSLMKEVSALGFNGPTYNEVLGNLTAESEASNDVDNNKNRNSENTQNSTENLHSRNETSKSNVTNTNQDSHNSSNSNLVLNITQISIEKMSPKNNSFNSSSVFNLVKPENNLSVLNSTSELTPTLSSSIQTSLNANKSRITEGKIEKQNSDGLTKISSTNNQKVVNGSKTEPHQYSTENMIKKEPVSSSSPQKNVEAEQPQVVSKAKKNNKTKKVAKIKKKANKKNNKYKKNQHTVNNHAKYGTEEFGTEFSNSGDNEEENEITDNNNDDYTMSHDFNWNDYDDTKLNEEATPNEHFTTDRESNENIEKMSQGENYENVKLENHDIHDIPMDSHELSHHTDGEHSEGEHSEGEHSEGDGITYNNIDKAKNMVELGSFEMKGIASAMDKLNKEDVNQLRTKMKNLEIIDTKHQKERLSEGTDYHEELKYVANDEPKVEVNNHVSSSILSPGSNEAFSDTVSNSNVVGDFGYHPSDERQDAIHDTINSLRQTASREPDIVEEATAVPLRLSPSSFQPTMVKKEGDQFEQSSNVDAEENVGNYHEENVEDEPGNQKLFETKGIDVASRSNLNNIRQRKQKSTIKLRGVARSNLAIVPVISDELQSQYFRKIQTMEQDDATKVTKRGEIHKEVEYGSGDSSHNSIIDLLNSTIKSESTAGTLNNNFLKPSYSNREETEPVKSENLVRHTHHILKVKDEEEKEEIVNGLVDYNNDKCVSLKLSNELGYRYRLISSINSHGYSPRGKFFTLKTVFKDPSAHKFVLFHGVDDANPNNQILFNGKKEIVKIPENCKSSPEIVRVSSSLTELSGTKRKRYHIHHKDAQKINKIFRKSSIFYPTTFTNGEDKATSYEGDDQVYATNVKDYTRKSAVTRPPGSEIFYGKLVLRTEPWVPKSILAERHFIFATRSSTYLKKDGDVFKIHNPGLALNSGIDSISFESVRWPGFFLKHRANENDFKFRIEKPDLKNIENFKKEATFIVEKYNGVEGSGLLRLFEKPDWYICVRKYGFQNSALKAMKKDNSKSFERRCSFFIEKLEPEMVQDELSKTMEKNEAISAKRKTVQKPAVEIRRLLDDYVSNGRNELVKDYLQHTLVQESKRDYVNNVRTKKFYRPLRNNPALTAKGKQWWEERNIDEESKQFLETNQRDSDNEHVESIQGSLIAPNLQDTSVFQETDHYNIPIRNFDNMESLTKKVNLPGRLDSYVFKKIPFVNDKENLVKDNQIIQKYTRLQKPIHNYLHGMRRDVVPGTKNNQARLLFPNKVNSERGEIASLYLSKNREYNLNDQSESINKRENVYVNKDHIPSVYKSDYSGISIKGSTKKAAIKVKPEHELKQRKLKKHKNHSPSFTKTHFVKKATSKKHSIPLVIYDDDVITIDKPSLKDKVDVVDYDEVLKTPKLHVKHVYADSNGHVEGYSPDSLVRKLTSPSNSLYELKKLGKHVKLGQKCKRSGTAIIDVAECDDDDPYSQIGNETIHLLGGEEEGAAENLTAFIEHDEDDRDQKPQSEDPIDSITTETADDDKESETEEIYGRHHHHSKNNLVENEEEDDAENEESDDEEKDHDHEHLHNHLHHHHHHHRHHNNNDSTHEEESEEEEEEEGEGKEEDHDDHSIEEDHETVTHRNAEDENNEYGQKMYHDEEHEWVDEKGNTHFYTYDAWQLKLQEDKMNAQNKTNSIVSASFNPVSSAAFNASDNANSSILDKTTKLDLKNNNTDLKSITLLNSSTINNTNSKLTNTSNENVNESTVNMLESSSLTKLISEDKKNNNNFTIGNTLKPKVIVKSNSSNKNESISNNNLKITDETVQNVSNTSKPDQIIKYVDEKLPSNFQDSYSSHNVPTESLKQNNKTDKMTIEEKTFSNYTDLSQVNRTDDLKANMTKDSIKLKNQETSEVKTNNLSEIKNKKVVEKNSKTENNQNAQSSYKDKSDYSQHMHEWKDENGDMHYYTEEAWKMKLADDMKKSVKTNDKNSLKNSSQDEAPKFNKVQSDIDNITLQSNKFAQILHSDIIPYENKQIPLNSSEALVKNIIMNFILKKPMLKKKGEQLSTLLAEGLSKQPLFNRSSLDTQERMLKRLKNLTTTELSLLYLKKLKSKGTLEPKLSEQNDLKPGEVIQGIVNELTKKQTYPITESFSNKNEVQNGFFKLGNREETIKWSTKVHSKSGMKTTVTKSNHTKILNKFRIKSANHPVTGANHKKEKMVINKNFESNNKKKSNTSLSKKHLLKSSNFESNEKNSFNVVSKFIEQSMTDVDPSISEEHKIADQIDKSSKEISIEKANENSFEENVKENINRELNNTNVNQTLHNSDENNYMTESGEPVETNTGTISKEYKTEYATRDESAVLKDNTIQFNNNSIVKHQWNQPQEQMQQQSSQQQQQNINQAQINLAPALKPETLKDIHIFKAGKPEPHLEGLKPKENQKKLEYKAKKKIKKIKQNKFLPTPSNSVNPIWSVNSFDNSNNKSTNENFPQSVKHELNEIVYNNKSNKINKYSNKLSRTTSLPVSSDSVNIKETLNLESSDPDKLFKQLEKSTQMLKDRLHVTNETIKTNFSEAPSSQLKENVSEKPNDHTKSENEEADVLSESAALVKLAGLDDFDEISGIEESQASSISGTSNDDDNLLSEGSGKKLLSELTDSKIKANINLLSTENIENQNIQNQDSSLILTPKLKNKSNENKANLDKLARFASDILKVHQNKELTDDKNSEINKSSLTDLLSSVLNSSEKDNSSLVAQSNEKNKDNDLSLNFSKPKLKFNGQSSEKILLGPILQEAKIKHLSIKKENPKKENSQSNESLSIDDDDTKDMSSISQALDEVMVKDGENSMKTLDSIDKSAQDILSEGSGDFKTLNLNYDKTSNDASLQENDKIKHEENSLHMKTMLPSPITTPQRQTDKESIGFSVHKNLTRNGKEKKVKEEAARDDLIHEFRQLLNLAEQKNSELLPTDSKDKSSSSLNNLIQSTNAEQEETNENKIDPNAKFTETNIGNTGDEGDEREGDLKSLHNKGNLEEMEDNDSFHQHRIVTVKDEEEKERMVNGLVTENDRCVSIQFENELGNRYKLVSSINNHGYTPRGKIFTLKQVFKDPRAHRYVSFHATDESDANRIVLLNGARELVAVPVSCRYKPRIIHVTSHQSAKLTNLFKKNGVSKKRTKSLNSPFDKENEVAMCSSRCTEYCLSSCPNYCCSAPVISKDQQQLFPGQKQNSNPFDEEMNVLSAGEEISDNAGGMETEDLDRSYSQDSNSDSQQDRWWW